MIILRKTGHQLLIFVEDYILVYSCGTNTQKTAKLPVVPPQSNPTKSLEEVLKPENQRITTACISKDAKFIGVALQNRQLVIYNSSFDVVTNILTKRAVSRMTFTNHNDVLVADKTGDVYLYKIPYKEPELLLGHLSMLLDVATSECGKYVITCDRDEKIRVSSYPNAYNIISYCLGHKEFVTNVKISGNMLISASGDGTIRFWDFKSGKQLFNVNTNEYVKDKNVVEQFCKDMDSEKVDVDALPVVDIDLFENNIAVLLLLFRGIQLYRMETCNGQLDVKIMQCIMVDSEVISFCLNRELFILTNDQLLMYNLSADGYKEATPKGINDFYANSKNLMQKEFLGNNVSALYKRKYDNVQDYLEKKKLRLESK